MDKKLAVIPARFASTRFPGKPLIDLLGKSMIQHVYERVIASNLFNEVVVATDDERIFNHVQGFGGKVLMTAAEHQTGTDRCGEVVEQFPEMDIVVNIQGDEPLVSKQQLAQLLSAFEDEKVEIATLGINTKDREEIEDANRIKLVRKMNGDALYFSRTPIPFERNSLEEFSFIRHIGIYAFKSNILKQLIQLPQSSLEQIESLEQLRWMDFGFNIRVMLTDIETPNIDVPSDVEKVLEMMRG